MFQSKVLGNVSAMVVELKKSVFLVMNGFACMFEFLQLLLLPKGDDSGLIFTYNYFYVEVFDKTSISFWVTCHCCFLGGNC